MAKIHETRRVRTYQGSSTRMPRPDRMQLVLSDQEVASHLHWVSEVNHKYVREHGANGFDPYQGRIS